MFMFGLFEIVTALTEVGGVDTNCVNDTGTTPLIWAARAGHEAVARLLLGQEDASPDRLDNHGQTPTSWAAVNGHAVVVRLPLGREEVNPDRPDDHGRTPNSWAAEGRNEAVVETLLERGEVNPDRPITMTKRQSCGPLNEHEGVVEVLLEREDVSPNRLGNRGQVQISWALGIDMRKQYATARDRKR